MPIEKINGRYAIQFERTFAFQPEKLIELCSSVLNASNPNEDYIVEVERCHSPLVVHSFEINSNIPDSAISCLGRTLPEDCYVFFFTEIESKNSSGSIVTQVDDEPNFTENSASKFIFFTDYTHCCHRRLVFKTSKEENIKYESAYHSDRSIGIRSEKNDIAIKV
ncbi:MAG: hypothetical protein IPM74_16815 [Crocinitomicaceae bacterium]|nr:hypothetical protein [Crocinitomicaceae bacterium]